MKVGVDASNIRAGGGVTHLTELLRHADPVAYGFSQVFVWGGRAVLDRLEERPWLVKCNEAILDKSLLYRGYWQCFRLEKAADRLGCDLLLSPGGVCVARHSPFVAMSQNLLPFEIRELLRYRSLPLFLKLLLLRVVQSWTFRRADGVIFLTEYARKTVLSVSGKIRGSEVIIPHGISHRFFCEPRPQRQALEFTDRDPCRVLYVSIIDVYKHQWNIVKAVSKLRDEGIPMVVEFVGPPGPGLNRLRAALDKFDPLGRFAAYRGAVPYRTLHEIYKQAEIGVFASSCENMPNIVLEAMASGLPLGCSSRGPMPEVLGNGGLYFDPERPDEITRTLRMLAGDGNLRYRLAVNAFERAKEFSWERCSAATFQMLSNIGKSIRKSGLGKSEGDER